MLLSAWAPSAAAAAGGFLRAEFEGARLEAGRRVEVRWQGLPPGIEEMELLLSCDGGRAFARAADRLNPSSVSYSWLVPNLPTEDAVLAIRGRINGRETLLLESEAFGIQRNPGLALHPLSYHGGELWTDPAGASTPATDAGLADPLPGTSLALRTGEEPEDGSPELDRLAPSVSRDAPSAAARFTAPALETERSRSPLVVPQRK